MRTVLPSLRSAGLFSFIDISLHHRSHLTYETCYQCSHAVLYHVFFFRTSDRLHRHLQERDAV